MTRPPLELRENEPSRPFFGSAGEVRALADLELAIVTHAPGSATWELAAGTKVGVARVGDLQVIVRPKIDMNRLVFLLGYTLAPTFWRDQTVKLDPDSDLVEAVAHSFARLTRRALEQGLLQGYLSTDESLPVVRGRIRFGDQLGHRHGTWLPVEVTYDEYTVNIAENRILLTAVLQLLRMPGVPASVRQALRRLRLQLAGVDPLTHGVAAPPWRPSRLNARYQPALRLAELVLAGDSFEQRVGDLSVSGFVLDMWQVYEDFVCVALHESLRHHGGRSELQHPMHLDRGGRVRMRPDFTWFGASGQLVVADAKYKAQKFAGYPNADLYQMLAYCTVLGVPNGHLVYARGNEAPTVHQVAGTDVTIHAHALDLAAPPVELLRQVDALADRMVQLTVQVPMRRRLSAVAPAG